ncbi:hypothetical protein ABK040_006352 [Willaertia magna]
MSFIQTSSLELIPQFFKITSSSSTNNINNNESNNLDFYELLLHQEIDKICGHGPMIDMKQFLTMNTGNEDSNKQEEQLIDFTTVQQILIAMDAFIFKVMSLDLNKNEILKELQNLQLTNENQLNLITTVIESRRNELIKSMKEKTTSEISSSYLEDFDWKLNLIVSSDKCSTIREPIALLNFYIKSENNQKVKEILVELTKRDLDNLLLEFDKIQHYIQKITI